MKFANNYKPRIPVDINDALDDYFSSMTSEPQSIDESIAGFAAFVKRRFGKDQRITVKLDALYADSQFINANFASGAARFVNASASTTGGDGESGSYAAFIKAVSDYEESKDESDTVRYVKLRTVIESMNAFVFSTTQTGGGGWRNAIACQPGFFRRIMRFIVGTFVSVGAAESPPAAMTAILAGGSVGLASQNVGSLEDDARKRAEAAAEAAAAANAARLNAEKEAKAAEAAAERNRREEEAAEMTLREAEKAANIQMLEDAARQRQETARANAEAAAEAEKTRWELAEAVAEVDKARRELAEAAAEAKKARLEEEKAAAEAEKARRELAEAAAEAKKARLEEEKAAAEAKKARREKKLAERVRREEEKKAAEMRMLEEAERKRQETAKANAEAAAEAEKARRELAEAAAEVEKARLEEEKAAAEAKKARREKKLAERVRREEEEKAAAEAERVRREKEAKKQLQKEIEIARLKKEQYIRIAERVKEINYKRHKQENEKIAQDTEYGRFIETYVPKKSGKIKHLQRMYTDGTKYLPRDWKIRPLKKTPKQPPTPDEYKEMMRQADEDFDNAVKLAENKFEKAITAIREFHRTQFPNSRKRDSARQKTVLSVNAAADAYNQLISPKKRTRELTPARRQYAYNTASDVRSLLAVLENTNEASFASHMLLSQLWDQNNVKYRIFTACFLYFITTADVSDIDDFNFMVPVYLSDAKDAIRTQVREILELYSKKQPYLTATEAQTYDMYPHEGLFWYELVNGLLASNLLCCVPREKGSELKKMFDKNASYTMNSYARYLIDFMKSNNIACSANNKMWQIQCEASDVRPLVKRQSYSDLSEIPENVLYICRIHGSLVEAKLVTIPFNVTLVKLGMCTKLTRIDEEAFYRLCSLNDTDITYQTYYEDVVFGGCEIVIPGSTYPELYLRDDTARIYRCDDKEKQLDPSKSVHYLSQLLDLVSKNVAIKQQHAIVYLSACQQVHSQDPHFKDPHQDRFTTALSNAFPALARGPKIIHMQSQNRLNVPEAIKQSALLRATKNDTPNHIVHDYLNRGGGNRSGGIWVGIFVGIATTITVAFLT
jgi:hypothetical protein